MFARVTLRALESLDYTANSPSWSFRLTVPCVDDSNAVKEQGRGFGSSVAVRQDDYEQSLDELSRRAARRRSEISPVAKTPLSATFSPPSREPKVRPQRRQSLSGEIDWRRPALRRSVQFRKALRRVAEPRARRDIVDGNSCWAARLVAQSPVIEVRHVHRQHPTADCYVCMAPTIVSSGSCAFTHCQAKTLNGTRLIRGLWAIGPSSTPSQLCGKVLYIGSRLPLLPGRISCYSLS